VKKYRVMYKPTENANELAVRTEEVYADGWRVETDKVVLYAHEQDADIMVFDVPKTRVMRIQEIGA
jgi:hypothetical protein